VGEREGAGGEGVVSGDAFLVSLGCCLGERGRERKGKGAQGTGGLGLDGREVC
jgi:hypothetical protein